MNNGEAQVHGEDQDRENSGNGIEAADREQDGGGGVQEAPQSVEHGEVGEPVQYHTKGHVFAARILSIDAQGRCQLWVEKPLKREEVDKGPREFPAFDVTLEPTTKVEHYYRRLRRE